MVHTAVVTNFPEYLWVSSLNEKDDVGGGRAEEWFPVQASLLDPPCLVKRNWNKLR